MSKLKTILKGRGMRQRELAIKAGVGRTTISMQSIHGIRSTRVAKRYAKILGCSPLDLLDL